MYTIGIGNMIDSSELTAIADGSDHVIIIDDFRALSGDSVLQRLLSSMPSELKCNDHVTITSTVTSLLTQNGWSSNNVPRLF